MQPRKARKQADNINEHGKIAEPMTLLRQAICQACGAIKIFDDACVPCGLRRRKAMELKEQERKAGVRAWEPDLARTEYERIFIPGLPRGSEYIKRRQLLALVVAVKEIRNCYTENQGGEYVLEPHNAERHQRILYGIDTIVNGYVNGIAGRSNSLTDCDRLIVGELGSTWHF